MTDFAETEYRHYCRNPKCRTKLPAPVSNPKEAFCPNTTCKQRFYRLRCYVCEEKKTGRLDAHTCGRRKCKNALRRIRTPPPTATSCGGKLISARPNVVPTPRGGTTPDKAPNSSVVMPPPAVIPAMPVKGIVDPASVRTVWGSPKRVSPYGADHTTDDRARRPGNDKSSSGTKSCADGVSPRTGGRKRRYSDSCDRGQRSPAQGCRKARC
jgi:hypothetical protein